MTAGVSAISGSGPIVSVVIPAYNAERTIGLAIRSVLAQTRPDFEIVVCDDASTDSTANVVQTFDDPRIRLIQNDRNLGTGMARDNAIALARGQWIALLDADDAWEPVRLGAMLVAASNEQTVVVDDVLYCHDTPSGMQPWHCMRGPRAFDARGAPVPVATDALIRSRSMLIKLLFSRELLQDSCAKHSKHPFGEDIYFLLKLLAGGGHLVYVPEPLYWYRITPGSASTNPQRHQMLAEIIRSAINDFPQQSDVQAALARKAARVEREGRYLPFLNAIKEGEVRSALRIAAEHPWLVPVFMSRVVHDVPYQLHRIAHGGAARSTGPLP